MILGACATGPRVKPLELAKVKSVAIVGFELVQQQPKDLDLSVGGGGDDRIPGMPPMAKLPVSSTHANDVYDVVRKTCAEDLAWKVADAQSLRKNFTYQGTYQEQSTGLRSLPPTPQGFDVFSVEGVMDWWAWEKLSGDERRKLIAALKTDAVLVVRARSQLKEGFSFKKLYGGGNFQPQVSYELKLYGADGEDVLWSDPHIQGAPTEKTVSHFGGISKRAALDTLVVEASAIAAKKLKMSSEGGPKK